MAIPTTRRNATGPSAGSNPVLTLAAFYLRHPEFATQQGTPAADAYAQAALDEAEARTDADVFADDTDAAHGFLTAHLLAARPQGKPARIRGEGFQTLYLKERERLEALHGLALALSLDT